MSVSTAVRTGWVIPTWLNDHIALGKPRIVGMAVFAAIVGFYMGHSGPIRAESMIVLIFTVAGTSLVGAGSSALNQVIERRHDACMERTRNRPVAAGRMRAAYALCVGLGVSVAGLSILAIGGNLVATAVAVATLVTYLAVYTPLKRRTPLAVLVGAVPGALPPVIGWAAASGSLDAPALLLFAIIYVWQIPHFLSIAWMYRADFAQAGFPVLPATDANGTRTMRRMIAYSCLLIPVSLLPTRLGLAGFVYYFGAFVCGFAFLAVACEVARLKTRDSARQHVLASLVYLSLVFALMTFDKLPA